MGWFIGIAGNFPEKHLERIKDLHPEPLFTYSSQNLYLATGGIPETCLFKNHPASGKGWIVCGSGIQTTSSGKQFIKETDWDRLFTHAPDSLQGLNGHYAVVQWSENRLNFYTDSLGLRNIFLFHNSQYLLFSTRLDWLGKVEDLSINKTAFAEVWMLFNQLSDEALLNSVKRLSQGGNAVFDNGQLQLSNTPWNIHQDKPAKAFEAIQLLEQFTLFPLEQQIPLSLALSGGMDSRVLLAFFLSTNHNHRWQTHTYESPNHPDITIARRITTELKVPFQLMKIEIPPPVRCLEELKEYVALTQCASPISTYFKMRSLPELQQSGWTMVDGGMGELLRRQFFKRLLLLNKKILHSVNPEKLYPFLQKNKGKRLFQEEVIHGFYQATLSQIEKVWHDMPPVNEIGYENWADLFILRTRFPNYAATEQSRSDLFIRSYMPYAQPEIITMGFNLPLKIRKAEHIHRKIIHTRAPELKNFPLVKDNFLIPYSYPPFLSLIHFQFAKRRQKYQSDQLTERVLQHLKEPIHDLIASQDVHNFEWYNQRALKTVVENYYRGDDSLAAEVEWWFTFELWRQSVTSKHSM